MQSNFDLKNYSDSFIRDGLKVKWNKYEVEEKEDNKLVYEFETNLKTKLDLESKNHSKNKNPKKIFSVYKLLVTENSDDTYSFEILKFIGNNHKDNLKDISLVNLATYNGTINYIKSDGSLIKSEIYNLGVLTNTIYPKSDPSILAKEPSVGGVQFVYVWVMEYIDLYTQCTVDCGGQDTFYHDGSYYYSHSTGMNSYWTLVAVPVGSGFIAGGRYHEHYDDPYFSSHGISPDIDIHDRELIIDPAPTFLTNAKINCTYDQLLKVTSIQKMLKDFMGKDAPYDLTMEVKPNPDCDGEDPHACTKMDWNSNDNKVHMIFDENYINDPTVPTISIARTLIHEIIHAAIFLEVKKMINGIPVKTDYPSLLQDYRDRSMESSHPIMSKHYVGTIANILKEVHSKIDSGFISLINSNYPDWDWNKYYVYQAFEGLDGTPEYEEHVQDSCYIDEANLYIGSTAKVNSTKIPNCN
jgi:hypothetical protein